MSTSVRSPAAALTMALVIAALVALAAALSAPPPSPAAAKGVQGDADCDAAVDSVDGLFILRFAANLKPFAECIQPAADVDCDGSIGVLDALRVLRFVAGLPPLPAPSGCAPIGGEIEATATPTLPASGEPAPTPPPTATPAATPTPHGSAPTPTIKPTPTATATPPPTPTATPTHTPEPTPAPPPLLALEETGIGIAEPNMLDMASIPGEPDQAIIATQTGQLWRVSLSGAFKPDLFGDITGRMTRVSDEGLLGITFAPGDPSVLYLNYTTGGEAQYWGDWRNGCGVAEWAPLPHLDPKRSRISRFAVTGGQLDLDSEQIILEITQPHCWHNASDLVFGPDGYLYVGVGDGGWIGGLYDGPPDTDDPYATILRIDVSRGGEGYSVPEDNPFADGDGPNFDAIWAYGVRHAWRFNFDPATGDLWTADTGENNWEEVNRIVRGGNYGWNVMEGTHCYPPWISDCDPPNGHIPPHAEYAQQPDNAAAIGGFVYRGDDIPGLQGWYVFGDFLRPRIFAVHPDFPGEPVVLYEGPLEPPCACLTSFAETPDGELLALIAPRGDAPGQVLRLAAAD